MMRNNREVELKPGYYAWCVDGAEGKILTIEKDNRGRLYVALDSGNTVHADMITQVLPPMRVLKGGVVKANPILKESAGEFDAYGKHRWFGESTNKWAIEQGFPYELESVSIHGNAPLALSKTRAYVMIDEDENGPVVETWPIRNLRFFSGTPQIDGWTRKANPDTFARFVDRYAARLDDLEFTPSRKEIEDALMPVVDTLLMMEPSEAAAYIRATFRGAGTYDALVVSMYKKYLRNDNPTPRLTRYDQKSQRERINPRTGKPTKAPSKRLKERRMITHHLAPEGVWANPLTRVKLKSPAQRGGADPSPRLLKRRRVTQKAPQGFYANPVAANSDRFAVQRQIGSRWKTLELFDLREFAMIFARAVHGKHPTWTIRVWDYGK